MIPIHVWLALVLIVSTSSFADVLTPEVASTVQEVCGLHLHMDLFHVQSVSLTHVLMICWRALWNEANLHVEINMAFISIF